MKVGDIVNAVDSKDKHLYRIMKIEGNDVYIHRLTKGALLNIITTLDKIKPLEK